MNACDDTQNSETDRANGAGNGRPAVFFDRDGVLNIDEGPGVRCAGDVRLFEGAGSAVRRVNDAGLLAICVTNQAAVAKGELTVAGLDEVTQALARALASDGGRLDDVFVCPHFPSENWPGGVKALLVDCDCRKPKPGLVLAAQRRHGIDLARSFIIGDRYRDLAAGRPFGVRGVLVDTGEAGSDAERFAFAPEHRARDLAGAVDYVLAVTAAEGASGPRSAGAAHPPLGAFYGGGQA